MMSRGYRTRQWLQSRFGEFRTGDRVLVSTKISAPGLIGDHYTGTVRDVVYRSAMVLPDPQFATEGHRRALLCERRSALTRIGPTRKSGQLTRRITKRRVAQVFAVCRVLAPVAAGVAFRCHARQLAAAFVFATLLCAVVRDELER